MSQSSPRALADGGQCQHRFDAEEDAEGDPEGDREEQAQTRERKSNSLKSIWKKSVRNNCTVRRNRSEIKIAPNIKAGSLALSQNANYQIRDFYRSKF